MSAILTEQQQEALVKDADLRAALAAYDKGDRVGKPGWRSAYVAQLAHEQQERDEAKTKIDALPRDKRRRALVRQELEKAAPNRDDIRHIHSVLAICGLPHTRLPITERRYIKKQGDMSLVVYAQDLQTPDGRLVAQPIPWGPKARLVLMHLCSEAVRQKSATIELADTFTAFVRELGFDDAGGPRGALTAFKQQVNALAACTMRLNFSDGQKSKSKAFVPIEDFELWMTDNPNQRSLWPSTLTFSPTMYESLKMHSMPVNMKAVSAFAGSSRKLDLYFWLGYRLHKIERPLNIGWEALAEQFGEGFTRPRDFRSKFSAELRHISEVFPKIPYKLSEKGLLLQPAGPDVLALPAPRPRAKKA